MLSLILISDDSLLLIWTKYNNFTLTSKNTRIRIPCNVFDKGLQLDFKYKCVSPVIYVLIFTLCGYRDKERPYGRVAILFFIKGLLKVSHKIKI